MSTRSGRLAWVDVLRGTALAGMIAYHAAWDLHAFGFSILAPGSDPAWGLFGRGVAALFLAVSGFSLSLAVQQGHTGVAMLRRLVRVSAAAVLVSVATWLVSPQAPIWFGILHCIVVTNVVAIVVRPLPSAMVLVVAAAAWLAPAALPVALGPAWAWTGLAAVEPVTLDFRPVLPWLAPVLVGLTLGRTGMGRWTWPWAASARTALPFRWAGRHSLAIYLIHQPLLLGVLVLASYGEGWSLQPPRSLRDPAQASAFLHQCRSDCTATGGEEALCRSSCDCVLTRLARPAEAYPSRGDINKADIASAVAACRRGDP